MQSYLYLAAIVKHLLDNLWKEAMGNMYTNNF